MPQPIEVIPVLSDGSVRTASAFPFTQPLPGRRCLFLLITAPLLFKARETTEACPTNLSKTSDPVVGNLGAWRFSEARERVALIPHLLSNLKLQAVKVAPSTPDTVLCGRVATSTITTSPHITVALRRKHPNGAHQYPKRFYKDNITDSIRVNRNLMAPDSFKNLGFGEESGSHRASAATATPAQSAQPQVHDKPRTL